MNSLQRGVTVIIHSALTGQRAKLSDNFNMEEAVKIAVNHKIEVRKP